MMNDVCIWGVGVWGKQFPEFIRTGERLIMLTKSFSSSVLIIWSFK